MVASRKILLISILLLSLAVSKTLLAGTTTTTVTTYVVKTQQERKSTRFTLTEWLRIKERMKMMDVWLAIFSQPEKDVFSPELNISYAMTKGDLESKSTLESGEIIDSSKSEGNSVIGQMWLTNLVSSTTGIRTVNIDFGFEGRSRLSSSFAENGNPESSDLLKSSDGISGSQNSLISETGEIKKMQRTSWMADLRLFGKNIQDSSLVVKAGKYTSIDALNLADQASVGSNHFGNVYGGEVQLYLFNWLGVEGNYLKYDGEVTNSSTPKITGQYHDYMAYIEISLLRIMAGKYEETWQTGYSGTDKELKDSGFMAAIKVQL